MTISKIHHAALSIDLSQPKVLFDHIKNGITITDENSSIVYINPAFTEITGYTKEEALKQNPRMLHSGQHDRAFFQDMWKQIKEEGFWEGEIWNRRKCGQTYPEFLTISKIFQHASDKFYYVAIFSDISFLKKDISKKLHLAFYDPLTELPNRNLFFDRINHIIRNIEEKKEKSVVVFYMDLDHFKQVNDTYGHCTGDKLLRIVGERMTKIVRHGDTIARIGGDEFTVILTSNFDKASAIGFAERIVKTIEEPFRIDSHLIHISISIGISFFPHDANDIESLLADADRAMYFAKKTGGKVICFDALPTP